MWKNSQVEYKLLPAPDFEPVPFHAIKEGVSFLYRRLHAGKNVYIHCKAGRGRSVTIVIAYLMQYHQLSYEEAYLKVLRARRQINLNHSQQAAVIGYSIDYEQRNPSPMTLRCRTRSLSGGLVDIFRVSPTSKDFFDN